MSCQHFIYSPETVYGTWVTPAKAVPVEESSLVGEREALDLRITGSCRSLYNRVLGAKPVSGSVKMPFPASYIGSWFKTFMRDTATTGAGPYVHTFLFDDTLQPLGISIQQRHTASVAVNFLSCVTGSMTITGATKAPVALEFALQGKDEALAGGTWEYDGSASPAVIASPTYATRVRPFMFYDAAILIGGTPSIASKIISVAAGTAYTKVLSAKVTVDLGLDTDGYGLVADPTRQEIPAQSREITVELEISWTDYSTVLYSAARAGTAMAFVWNMVAGANEAHIIVPALFFDPVKLPSITGAADKKTITLTGKAIYDTVTSQSFNLWLKTGEATV